MDKMMGLTKMPQIFFHEFAICLWFGGKTNMKERCGKAVPRIFTHRSPALYHRRHYKTKEERKTHWKQKYSLISREINRTTIIYKILGLRNGSVNKGLVA